ncbi:hypothetical protein FBZ93_12815 [Bradyrhizobium macuxiense]|uniref:Restriction endonuclease type IV Mrr domain-containing protein n=1 Tax=Bradyrhizobium macuxiense TaxID=1755647 RepID=A0A560KUC0_9BRAD|nr:hypothetical protein [Bradyrhizobium macuxiense]TWB86775.1 hypothetical protein FBZ93_12815 [Bradyrhizobium macuxiense]
MELDFARQLKVLLEAAGTASEEYITAQMQPFSHQQRPDVVFVPNAGGYAGQVVFLEIKLTSKQILHGRGFANLVENREFAEESLERPIGRYILVTSQSVPAFSARFLADRNVTVFDEVTSPEVVIERLREQQILI